jgi:hypothetical protein
MNREASHSDLCFFPCRLCLGTYDAVLTYNGKVDLQTTFEQCSQKISILSFAILTLNFVIDTVRRPFSGTP